MNLDSDSWLKWIGITLLVLAVGYLLFRAGVLIWRSVGAFRNVYQVSTRMSTDERRTILDQRRVLGGIYSGHSSKPL
jgi:hypothetical protein